ncbi:MAG: RluA family pseudouridine synthase [Alphaproteobacteria bacterium]|nr:RluA family pseudouridine synthase [Alphaproteobacteria bacterium]
MAENIIVDDMDDGQRLDRWLKKKFPDLGFAQTQKLLRTGQVRVDGKRSKGDTRLVSGQSVRVPPQVAQPTGQKKKRLSPRAIEYIRSMVIYEDEHLIALNKPAGIAVQGGSKITHHIDGMLDGLAVDGHKPHLVHRLDKETSGVLLLARTPKAAKKMGDLFKGREIRKYYWAITVPSPTIHHGKISSAVAKVAGRGGERMMAVDDDSGKGAVTYYSVMEDLNGKVAWVVFWPRTGRMHQIRVHAAQINCPLMGDYKYGPDQSFLEENPALPDTLHLHARRVIFRHPFAGMRVDITAPLDEEMQETFDFFHFDANNDTDPFEELEK